MFLREIFVEVFKGYIEPFLEERTEAAQKYARKIAHGTVDNVEEFETFLRWVIGKHYGLPIFDSYFERRTLDELIFEATLISELGKDNVQKTSEVIKENQVEAESLFDDWIKEDLPKPEKPETMFDKEDEEFMKSGKFKGEE